MTIPVPEPDSASGSPGGPAGSGSAGSPPAAGSAGAERSEWSRLAPEAKRERLLAAAADVFSRRGLDAPMSEVAEAAGAGVASIYRAFPSKHELLAALVSRRLDQFVTAAEAAYRRDGDRWTALTEMLRSLAEAQRADYTMLEARMRVADHPDVIAAGARVTEAQERLLEAARAEGRLRPDATTLDLRLLFAATRAARNVEPTQWRRMLELMIDALDTRRGQ